MKRLTLEKIAELAGVSRATVSRVVNGHPNIRTEVRERVQKVIDETGYEPNRAARSLASNRSNIIGVFKPLVGGTDLFIDPYYPKLINGISHECNQLDYVLSLFIFRNREEERTKFNQIINSGLVDGLILTASVADDPYVPILQKRGVPFVMVGRAPYDSSASFIDADNIGGASTAASHLIRTGYKRIACISPESRTTVGQDRLGGFLKAFEDRQVPINRELIVEGDFTFASGVSAMRQLLPLKPDAVFAGSDAMALGAMQAIQEAGLKVPDDIAVVGFDDFPAASNAVPPLTTIRQPVEESGSMAVRTLVDMIDTESREARGTILPVELIVRKSCGALR
ncbi:MAG: LacI family transcriptional regulator [Anaerolineaceae bacterium]|nr:MAG: LacI family transcriptional regulator [Anaerolineaceae bacterium]